MSDGKSWGRNAVASASIGASIGLAWATSLRAWMTHLTIEFGSWPQFTWGGTFLAVLLPAVLVGALIGYDWHRRQTRDSRVPLVVWSPMLLVVGPALIADNFIGTLMETGEGSGAISVVLIGMGGGFAISGRGAGWARVVAGLLAFGVIGGVMVFMFYFKDQAPTPSATFGGIYLAVLLVLLAVGCSVPMRKLTMRKLTSDNSSRPTVRNSVP